MTQDGRFRKCRVLTADISLGGFDDHIRAFAELGGRHESAYVCCVNAHMTAEARDPVFAGVVNGADFATADGMPVLYTLRLFHRIAQERVAGNDILPALLGEAARRELKVFLYGGRQEVLDAMVERAGREFPGLVFAGTHSPPFAPLEEMDLDADAALINATGAHIIMVSLGCPKQERWMASMKGRVKGVMLGLGGAFLLYAGMDTRAPKWMRDLSLEWCYRLWLEPGRLWKRYLVTNSIFLGLFLRHGAQRLFGGRPGGASTDRAS